MTHLELIRQTEKQAEEFKPFLVFAPPNAKQLAANLEALLPAYARTLEAVQRARQMAAGGRQSSDCLKEIFEAVGGNV